MLTKNVINNILGKNIVNDKISKNRTSITSQLVSLMQEYPNDYVVITSRWGSDYKVYGPYTYRSQAESVHSQLLERLDADWKFSVYVLNQNSLRGFL